MARRIKPPLVEYAIVGLVMGFAVAVLIFVIWQVSEMLSLRPADS